ncbi:MAG: glycosyltransferase [Gammaproteobacteria bacterium]|nr:glycosyltransferase [Gammaproteobacteria bacterium]
MKIIHIITGLDTGGAERALYNLLYGGLADHFNCHIISLSGEGTMGPLIRELGVPVTTLGMRGGRLSLSGLVKLRRVVREFQPDLIQGWMYHGNLGVNLARALAPGCPSLVWNIRHSLYDLGNEKLMTQKVIRLNKFFSTSPDALLYNSQLSRKQHESFGFSSLNGRVIPNGIDVQKFCFSDEARKRVRLELSIPVDTQVVGHVARLHPMKDHPAFLRVAVKLALKYPTLHFLLSGLGVSFESEILEQLVPAQVRDRFHLLDERDDVSELMSAMDIFCLSSAWGEGFPNVIGEAMAAGVPCVATDVGDSAIVIGDVGVAVPLRDEEALAAGIESLLSMPREERRALSVRVRERIETSYTLTVIVEQYVALYETLMIGKRVR